MEYFVVVSARWLMLKWVEGLTTRLGVDVELGPGQMVVDVPVFICYWSPQARASEKAMGQQPSC